MVAPTYALESGRLTASPNDDKALPVRRIAEDDSLAFWSAFRVQGFWA